ncbi:MAG: hypothetical protein UU09_C0039G0005 [Microgenomates group bacterium GW2011_GWA2_40_6]|nr:MAG: hypothetical protein UU09_C0039G0005 [Microgenomates group bacterium GW2011_GWA2_40_6]
MLKELDKRLNFDPVNEVGYLRRFGRELRRQQLGREIGTSLAELFLSEHSHEYQLVDDQICDVATGIPIRSLSNEGESEERIEKMILGGAEIVVNVSPKNKELSYFDDVVDIWKVEDGGRINLFRFKVDMSEAELASFDKLMGGEVKEFRLVEVVAMLNLSKARDGVSIGKIMTVAKELVASFERNYGEKLFLDAELITRLYVAVRLEVERKREECPVIEREVVVDPFRIQQYLYGELKTVTVVGGGCGGSSLSGEFGQGIIIVKTADGLTFKVGSTEGLSFCPKCGCFYSGDKCPICN